MSTVRMRTISLFLQCACAQLLYSCRRIRTTFLFLQCASAYSHLLYSYSAHAHNFSNPTVRMGTASLFLQYNTSISTMRMRTSSLFCGSHARIFSFPAVRMINTSHFLQCMRKISLFLRCTCAELLYSCSVDGHNFSLPAMHIGTTSKILNCACAQLLYSCSAHAHNCSIPTMSGFADFLTYILSIFYPAGIIRGFSRPRYFLHLIRIISFTRIILEASFNPSTRFQTYKLC
jgi:hypothetical protein